VSDTGPMGLLLLFVLSLSNSGTDRCCIPLLLYSIYKCIGVLDYKDNLLPIPVPVELCTTVVIRYVVTGLYIKYIYNQKIPLL